MNGPAESNFSADPGTHLEPVWAREEAFQKSPDGFGWIDRKGNLHPCASVDELSQAIRSDKDSTVDLVWTPDHEFCQVPEEVDELSGPISEVRKQWVEDDLAVANDRMKWVGGGLFLLVLYQIYLAWGYLERFKNANGVTMSAVEEAKSILKALINSTTIGIGLLVFLIFAFIPWYQARKRKAETITAKKRPESVIAMIRFETWLGIQNAPVTKGIIALIALVFAVQAISDGAIFFFNDSIDRAGLVKPAYRSGEYWRLVTAPMLHGGLLHFGMNALAALYLGKRLEVFARWPHLPAVFVFSALVAGEASARFVETKSVGASGGLMGWLGFLLVFETLHSRLVPRSSRRMLIGGVILTGLIGLIGYKFIDNAAHAGGLVAGMAYALIVFPKSSSTLRPTMNFTDRMVGFVSLVFIACSAVLAMFRIIS